MLIYHRVPEPIVGRYLCPLNELRSLHPQVYAEEVKKYEGREALLSERVSNLNCLWNDVLHFSPVHPKLIGAALVKVGFTYEPRRWFAIDPSQHGFTPSNTSLFLHLPRVEGQQAEEFVEFSPAALERFQELPDATMRHYVECKASGARPLLFAAVPHVLFRGRLKIADLKTIEA